MYVSGYSQLRQLRSVVRLLSVHATKTLVEVLISSRLDYCNSLLYGINDRLLRHVQSVQNEAVRLMTGTRRCGWVLGSSFTDSCTLELRH